MDAVMAGFIAAQRTDCGVPHAVSLRALDVAPSTFYKHLNRPPTEMQVRRQALDAEVKRAFGKSQGTYGSPRVRAQLRRDGVSVSKKTVEASMARQGLQARPKKKKGLTSQNPDDAAPEDLLCRDFSADGVNQKQFGDFKEVKTAEGPVFSATVLDLCSRRMVGFATSDYYPTAELAKTAINTAVATRGGNIKGVIFHSDKGIHPVHRRGVRQSLPAPRHRTILRKNRQRPGQRPGRVVLLHLAARAHRPTGLDDQSPGPPRNLAVGPQLVQPAPTSLSHRHGPTGRIRTHPHP